ncbi:MAG TPA: alpha/beta hydrolase [Candidatus Eremiobacteraceae bacterium]|nr:alpha/beta hydrolase [Candidatus Eremiobacteraceae bacterium]
MPRLALLICTVLGIVLLCAGQAGSADQDSAVTLSTIAYGDDFVFQTLDIYVPRFSKGEPLIVFVHGGGWMKGDKSQYSDLGYAFARRGVAFAALNYRLAPAASVDQQADDVAAAMRWLLDAAGAQGYAADRVFLMGHSAGAELAAFTATSPGALRLASLSKKDISGVIAVDGAAYNPTLDALQASDPQYLWLDHYVFGNDVAQWKQYDIGRNLDGNEPPFLVVHGRHDRIVSVSQPQLLVTQLRAAGDRVAYLQPDSDHNTVLRNMMTMPDDPLRVAITRFVSTGSLNSL